MAKKYASNTTSLRPSHVHVEDNIEATVSVAYGFKGRLETGPANTQELTGNVASQAKDRRFRKDKRSELPSKHSTLPGT